MKHFNFIKFIFIFVFLFITGFVLYLSKTKDIGHLFNQSVKHVFAEEDDEEEEDHKEEDKEDHEDEDDDDDERHKDNDNDDESEVIYQEESVPVYTTVMTPAEPVQPIIRYITILDPGYDIDTDKDGLVDALDPHPTINEKELFTDDDNDGIANANDNYPGEDDFTYFDFSDENNNGILDAFEN